MKLLHEGELCGQILMPDLQPAEGIAALRCLQLAALELASQNVASLSFYRGLPGGVAWLRVPALVEPAEVDGES
jgi:hypothetical protein